MEREVETGRKQTREMRTGVRKVWERNGSGLAGGAAVGRGERDGIEEERVWRYVEGGRRRGKRGTRIMGERGRSGG